MSTPIKAMIGGLISLVIGLILLGIVISTASTTGSDAQIGSFTGVQDLNDLAPLVFAAVVVVGGAGLIGIGFAGVAGRGPLAR